MQKELKKKMTENIEERNKTWFFKPFGGYFYLRLVGLLVFFAGIIWIVWELYKFLPNSSLW